MERKYYVTHFNGKNLPRTNMIKSLVYRTKNCGTMTDHSHDGCCKSMLKGNQESYFFHESVFCRPSCACVHIYIYIYRERERERAMALNRNKNISPKVKKGVMRE